MNRFLIPMFALVNAATAEQAIEQVADHVMDVNKLSSATPRLRLCENSDPEQLREGADDPHDLSGNPAAFAQAELEQLRKEVASLSAERAELEQVLKRTKDALSGLVDECNTNNDFADEHASEVEALAAAESAELELSKAIKQLRTKAENAGVPA